MQMPILSEFLKLLNDAEDYFSSGFREEHTELMEGDAPAALSKAAAGAVRDSGSKGELERISREVSQCTLCDLHGERTLAVPGEGCPRPLVLIVGEGPGAEEDRTGRPFVGPAGRYLDRWLEAVKIGGEPLSRARNTFIANVVKCRPPGNRDPGPEEIRACLPFLERQVGALEPKAILTLGRVALHTLTGTTGSLGSLRGRLYAYRNIPVVPTYHPAAVLRELKVVGRQAPTRSHVWEDLKRLKALLENEALR